jgi:hypothetical protein
MKSIAAVPGEKQTRITVKMPHGHPPGWAPQEIGLFIDHYLRGGEPLATVEAPTVAAGKVSAKYRCVVPLEKAELHFTTDDKPINQREWQTVTATVADGVVTADAPPAGATAWFFTVTDTRGAVTSSTVEFGLTAAK